MAASGTPQGSLRQRNVASSSPSRKAADAGANNEVELDKLVKAAAAQKKTGSEWDHRIALTVMTILGFVTRFWGISHPNEVVFDEVHFGKVRFAFRRPDLRCPHFILMLI